MRLIVATNNPGKLAELEALLPPSVELLTLRDAGLDAPDEIGTTFLDNARIKALAAAALADGAIADDSGLEVDALSGAPGVHSARFAGQAASDDDNNRALLAALAEVPANDRTARFVSCVVLALPDGREWHASGTIQGRIGHAARGSGGFGYDPLFEIDDASAAEFSGRTMAELSRSEKNSMSHRARAYRALVEQIDGQGIWPHTEPDR
jgi:XTP/dITP diphosphohydrolase